MHCKIVDDVDFNRILHELLPRCRDETFLVENCCQTNAIDISALNGRRIRSRGAHTRVVLVGQ